VILEPMPQACCAACAVIVRLNYCAACGTPWRRITLLIEPFMHYAPRCIHCGETGDGTLSKIGRPIF
jgi:hypothetical protein